MLIPCVVFRPGHPIRVSHFPKVPIKMSGEKQANSKTRPQTTLSCKASCMRALQLSNAKTCHLKLYFLYYFFYLFFLQAISKQLNIFNSISVGGDQLSKLSN